MPPSEASPSSALSSPATRFSSVLLPTPLAPTSPTCSPAGDRETRRRRTAGRRRDARTRVEIRRRGPCGHRRTVGRMGAHSGKQLGVVLLEDRSEVGPGPPRAAPRPAGGSAASSPAGSERAPMRRSRTNERSRASRAESLPRRPRALTLRRGTRGCPRHDPRFVVRAMQMKSGDRASRVRPGIGPVGDHERLTDDQAGSHG